MQLLSLIIVVGSTLFGLAIGSFIAARVLRVARNLPANLWGRSQCLSCKKALSARDLIPAFSYLFLRGKCRHCQEPISSVYVVIELVTALGFGLLMYFGLQHILPYPIDFTSQTLFFEETFLILGTFSVLVYVSALDLMIMAFPVKGLAAMTIISLLASTLLGLPIPLTDALMGGLAFAGTLALIRILGKLLRGIEAMGEGDLWIAGLIGVSLGLQRSIIAFYAAFILGALVALMILLRKKPQSSTAILPFAPFLTLGWGIALLFGNQLFTLLFPF